MRSTGSPKSMKARQNPGLHRVGQQLGTELRKRRVKRTDEKDLVKNDHEDSARSSGVTGPPWPIAPVLIRRNTTMARPGDSDVTSVSSEFHLYPPPFGLDFGAWRAAKPESPRNSGPGKRPRGTAPDAAGGPRLRINSARL
jgi:hypothetical protein